MEFITDKIDTYLYLDTDRYDLMSLRAHKGRLIAIIHVIAHISAWFKESYMKIYQEGTYFIECRNKLWRILIIPLIISRFVFFNGILHITIIVFNILGIAVPEIGRRARNVYRNFDIIKRELHQWLEESNVEVKKKALQTLHFLPPNSESELDHIFSSEADKELLLPSVTHKEIDQKYKVLALKLHPDKSDEDREAFQELLKAKIILLQPKNIFAFLKKSILHNSDFLRI